MLNRQYRVFLWALAAMMGIWTLAWSGYRWAERSRVTAEKVYAYLDAVQLDQLTGEARQRALDNLAAMLNALSVEERRQARLEKAWTDWFRAMTEAEKSRFLDATVPVGFQQMLTAFEQMPEDKRQRAIDLSLKRLQEARQRLASEDGTGIPRAEGTNAPLYLSNELRERVIKMGLKAYYSESSAQTKAELAPLLEEIQKVMERGPAYLSRHGFH